MIEVSHISLLDMGGACDAELNLPPVTENKY
jgi:hypothetical protein